MLACLLDMKLTGYGYAIIGGIGPTEFYRKVAGAVEIPAFNAKYLDRLARWKRE